MNGPESIHVMPGILYSQELLDLCSRFTEIECLHRFALSADVKVGFRLENQACFADRQGVAFNRVTAENSLTEQLVTHLP